MKNAQAFIPEVLADIAAARLAEETHSSLILYRE